MGKQSRQTRRQAEQAAAAEAALRAERHRRQRPYWIAGSVVVVGAVIALIVVASSGGGSAGLPQGTQVFTEPAHHVAGTVHYNRNPPAGGDHSATWLNCGVYVQPVPNENAVHDLEHGAVWVTYRPGLSSDGILQLRQFVESNYQGVQRYLVLSPYPGLPAPVVASAWGAQIRLSGPSDPRLTTFVSHFIGGNQGNEQGAPCTGGTGTPVG